ncbi:MAG: hypothetical protein KGY69_17855 [Bacteroidales bacterium]|nr:hypothetical protein [Bacteroidales bacterium]
MIKKDQLEILQGNALALESATPWLERSYNICRDYDPENLDEEGMDAFETLTSRFARVTDLLFNKVFRSIVYVEEGETYTLIDTLNFMAKRGVIDNMENARIIKELRNDIVHEYVMEDLHELFKEILNNCPKIFQYTDNAQKEVEKLKRKLKM